MSKLDRQVVHLNTVTSGGSIPSLIRSLSQEAGGFGYSVEALFGRGKPPDDLQHNRVGNLHSQACDLLCSQLLDRPRRTGYANGLDLARSLANHRALCVFGRIGLSKMAS